MIKKRMTAEEFGEFVFGIYETEDENKDANTIISDSKKIYKATLFADIEKDERNVYKNDYIKKLIKYGFDYKKHDNSFALKYFGEAKKLDQEIPIVYYRIGHIHFNKNNYSEALHNFDKSIKIRATDNIEDFSLNKEQILNAKKIMAYCSLMIFKNLTEDSLKSKKYPELDILIKEYVNNNEYHIKDGYIKMQKIIGGNPGEVTFISNEEYEDLLEKDSCVILDNYGNPFSIFYNNCHIQLQSLNFRLLEDILLGKLKNIREYVKSNNNNEEILKKSFKRKISRLREAFELKGLNENIFAIKKEVKSEYKILTSLPIIIFSRIYD